MASSARIAPFQWRDILNGHALAFLVLVAASYLALVIGLAVLLLAPTGKGGQYIVVLPPWAEVGRIFEMSTALNARVLGLNTRSNAYLLYLEGSDAVDALNRAGAWLVLDPQKVGGLLGCGPTPQRPATRTGASVDGIGPVS